MPSITARNKLMLGVAKSIFWPVIKTTSYKHYAIPEETAVLMAEQKRTRTCSLLFVSPHRSMWETIGIPYAISMHHGDLPFALMGSNLVKDAAGRTRRVLDRATKSIGGIMVERDNNVMKALPEMVLAIESVLSTNNNLLLFPEGTRSRDGLVKPFRPAGFQGAINAAGCTDVYVVPSNVDYSLLFEMDSFAKGSYGKYSFKFRDFRKWRTTYLDDIHVSFGVPFKVEPTDNRNELAERSRSYCLDLVSILPVNVLSEAMVRLQPRGQDSLPLERVHDSIDAVIADLDGSRNHFRGFRAGDPPESIVEKAGLGLDARLLPVYTIYAQYVAHHGRS